ncbi:MAG: site-specific integrase [Desulfovibrionaceae bacterium]|nr:site-specific integrase [Desulfovibrionaceae bacterium]
MPSIYQRKTNGKWMVAFKDSTGKRHDKTFGRGAEGEEAARDFLRRIINGEVQYEESNTFIESPKLKFKDCNDNVKNEEKDCLSFAMLVEEYRVHLERNGSSEGHVNSFLYVVNAYFIPFLGEVEDINNIDYYKYILPIIDNIKNEPNCFGKKRENITVNQYVNYLRALFNYACRRDYICKSPLILWRPLKVKRKDRLITFEDAKKIMSCAADHIKWAIQLVCYLGVRPGKSELFNLKWSDVDFERNRILVYASKTNTHRYIYFTDEFKEIMLYRKSVAKTEFIVEFNNRNVKTIKTGFCKAVLKSGITYPVKLYDFRHLFATEMISKGADIAAVSRLMGHSRISTTVNSYYETRSDEMKRAINLLPAIS